MSRLESRYVERSTGPFALTQRLSRTSTARTDGTTGAPGGTEKTCTGPVWVARTASSPCPWKIPDGAGAPGPWARGSNSERGWPRGGSATG